MNNWTQQPQDMWQNWSNAQQTMWQNWTTMMSNGQNGPFTQDMFSQWQKMMQQGWQNAMPNGTTATGQNAFEQLFANQGAMMKFWDMTNKAWQQISDQVAQGQDWQTTLQQFIKQMKNTNMAAAFNPENMTEMWQKYMAQWQQFNPMNNMGMPDMGSAFQFGDTAEFGNFYWDAYEQTVGKWINSPNLGLNREFNEKVERGFSSWVEVQRTKASYQEKVNKIWADAFQKFMQSLVERQQNNDPITGVKELMLAWTAVAEEVFTEAFRTEEYVTSQAEQLNAQMAYRIHKRAIVEVFLQMNDLPTRTELDETHRRIYELRKEVKSLKKEMAAVKAQPTAKPKAKPATRRSRTTKKTTEK